MNLKKIISLLAALALLLTLFGCAKTEEQPQQPQAPETTQTTEDTQSPATEEAPRIEATEQTGYDAILETYRTALSENWSIEELIAQDLSLLSVVETEGNAMEQVGYAIVDVTGEGVEDLIIASTEDFPNMVVFDLYTIVNDEVVHLCSSTERSRYYLTLLLDTGTACQVIHHGSNGAGQSEWFALTPNMEDQATLTVNQAIRYDGNEENPWSMGYWDGSQVVYSPTDEDLALAVMEAAELNYYLPELTPFAEMQ